jgi:predicted nuclease with TOPRIM domain
MKRNEIIDGILVNPITPEWMDFKDINERSEEHLEEWFNKPYIRVTRYEAPDNSYEEYFERLKDCNMELESEEEFNTRIARDKKSWFNKWGEDGLRYDVRILDGGAWDRTTNKGSYSTLEEALKVAKELLN